MESFYRTTVEYLGQWSGHLNDLSNFLWSSMKGIPKWSDVKKSCDFAAKRIFFYSEHNTGLFNQFSSLIR